MRFDVYGVEYIFGGGDINPAVSGEGFSHDRRAEAEAPSYHAAAGVNGVEEEVAAADVDDSVGQAGSAGALSGEGMAPGYFACANGCAVEGVVGGDEDEVFFVPGGEVDDAVGSGMPCAGAGFGLDAVNVAVAAGNHPGGKSREERGDAADARAHACEFFSFTGVEGDELAAFNEIEDAVVQYRRMVYYAFADVLPAGLAVLGVDCLKSARGSGEVEGVFDDDGVVYAVKGAGHAPE